MNPQITDAELERIATGLEKGFGDQGADLNTPFIGAGSKSYSAQDIIDEVRMGTEFGRQYAARMLQLEEQKRLAE